MTLVVTLSEVPGTGSKHGRCHEHLRNEDEHTLQSGMDFKALVWAARSVCLGQYTVWVGFIHLISLV